MLKIKNLSKKINAHTILNNINLDLKSGDIAILLGPSGVGKTTLLRILNNLENYDNGTISLDSKILKLNQTKKSSEIGMVFQHFNLFKNMTVLENITFALEKAANKTPKEAKTIANNLLKKFNLEDKANLYPNKLSGGQKQRLAIARTLSLKPKVICLDEPTSALDPNLTNQIAKIIQNLSSEGYIILLTTHDISLVKNLNGTIYLMEKGTIVNSVKSQEFATNPEDYPEIRKFISGQN